MLRLSQILIVALLTFSGTLLTRAVWSSPVLASAVCAVFVACLLAVLFQDNGSRRN